MLRKKGAAKNTLEVFILSPPNVETSELSGFDRFSFLCMCAMELDRKEKLQGAKLCQ